MILVALFCATNIFASGLKATQFYVRYNINQEWTEWESKPCDLRVTYDKGKIIIGSPASQKYTLGDYTSWTDYEENKIITFSFFDQDWNRGIIEFVMYKKLQLPQVYIKYDNIQWAYDLEAVD